MHNYKLLRKISYQNLKKSKQTGATLIEAVVAIFVMSFGVLALMLAQINSVNVSVNSANQSDVTRAVQNYVEEMRAKPELTLKETKDSESNKILFLHKGYNNFASTDCKADLNINLINSTVTSCTISPEGKIKVTWGDQAQAKEGSGTSNDFVYTLQAGQE
ncbi:MAG: hypothetical protein J6568_00660 [Snodgrassella sp.]|nr:hypothetical protein [Snodgrassella sp.]